MQGLGPGCKVWGAGFRVKGAGFGVQGLGSRMQVWGCRVEGLGCSVKEHPVLRSCFHLYWKLDTSPRMIDPGLLGSGRGTTRAEDARGTPNQSHMSPSILV